jgi:hypothetical protein
MTFYEPNPDVQPTGEEPAEFVEPPETPTGTEDERRRDPSARPTGSAPLEPD